MRAIRMISGISCPTYAIGAGPAKGGWYRETDGVARYKVMGGDNLSSLALKYLGSSKRYPEIIEAQAEPRKSQLKKNPNLIYAGEIFWMPTEAANKAIALGLLAPPAKPAPAPSKPAPAPAPAPSKAPAPAPPPVVLVRPPVQPSSPPSAPQSSMATSRVNTSPTPGIFPSFVKPAQASTGPEPSVPRAPMDSSGRPANERPENPEAPPEPASTGLPSSATPSSPTPSSATPSSATPAPSASRSPETRPPQLPERAPTEPVPIVVTKKSDDNIPLILLGGLSLLGIGWALTRKRRAS